MHQHSIIYLFKVPCLDWVGARKLSAFEKTGRKIRKIAAKTVNLIKIAADAIRLERRSR